MYVPYNFQCEAIRSIFQFFQTKKGNPLVVAPTGSGKSVIIACLCQIIKDKWPAQKILILSHIKEILGQNYSAVKKQNPMCEIGVYSAGLGRKEIKDITIAGIQSVYNKPEIFQQFDIIIVDECHTIPPSKTGMYPKFFKAVKKPIIGFTATPYRLGSGYLHFGNNSLFTDIVYTIPIKKLQREGYLCKLTSKGTKKKLKADNIKKQAGDFIIKELSKEFDRKGVTKEIIQELLLYKEERKKWLLFAIDIAHAEHITTELRQEGIKAAVVHSKMKGDRKVIIDAFKEGYYQALVSVAVLTTGFDVPSVDLIGLLRPTASPVLHVQIIGRGLRVAPGKKDCLVLDFAGNLMRNGPIDAPVIKIKNSGSGEPIMKECPACWEIVHAATRICPACGHKFIFRHKLKSRSENRSILSEENWHPVKNVEYSYYVGSRGIPMLKVVYDCGVKRFAEYICVEHKGYARYKAKYWWETRCKISPLPKYAKQALELSNTLVSPTKILVNEAGEYPDIKDYKFKNKEKV